MVNDILAMEDFCMELPRLLCMKESSYIKSVFLAAINRRQRKICSQILACEPVKLVGSRITRYAVRKRVKGGRDGK